MPTLPRTPSRPAAVNRCDGLLVQLSSKKTKAKGLALARRLAQDQLPGRWQVKEISYASRLYEFLRTTPKTQPTIRQGFDLARKLEALPEVAMAEIGAIVPGVDPAWEQVYPKAQAQAQAKSLGEDEDKPCSAFDEWPLTETEVQNAWALTPPGSGKRFGEGIEVAHPDTGYTLHPEIVFDNRVLIAKGYDFEDDDPHAKDPLKGGHPSHGTSTASVIMSTQGKQVPQNAHFVSGIAPAAKLIPIRVSTSVVHLSFRRVTRAVYHAIDQNPHVISMSLGGPFFSRSLKEAIALAVSKGIIVIAAAGNGWPFVVYPAKLDKVLAIAASNCQRKPWRKSASGSAVDVTAPGESIWRAKTTKSGAFNTERSSGTSYSTAMTAGACALWLAYHDRAQLIATYGKRNLAAVFREVLVTQGIDTPAGWKTSRFGAGIVNVRKLLEAPLPAVPPAGAGVPPKSPTNLEQVLELLPGVTTAKAKAALAKIFQCRPSELPKQLLGYAEEFAYHLATNPDLRAAIERRAMAKTPKGVSRRILAKPELLGKRASRGLKQHLGIK